MIPSLSPSSNLFLDNLNRLQDKISNVTAQVSSGYQISQPSDAPDQISPLLQLQASLSHNQAVSENLTNVKAQVTGADQAVGSAIQLLDQALSLGAQGANATTTAATDASLSQQVQGIQQQLVSISNTQVAGVYVFSGDQATSPSYAYDPTQPTGVQRLITPSATSQVELADGTTANVELTAGDLFDERNADDSIAPGNVFAAVNSLAVALQNNDQAGITAAVTSLQTASSYLNSQETFYGNTENRIASAITQISTENTSLQQQISNIRDTNEVQAALTLTSAETQQQAAMAAEAKRPNTSLFDFLG
jgi:flagellar hook-associated protein 3 FlgL